MIKHVDANLPHTVSRSIPTLIWLPHSIEKVEHWTIFTLFKSTICVALNHTYCYHRYCVCVVFDHFIADMCNDKTKTTRKKGADTDSSLCHGCGKVPCVDDDFKCPSCKHNFCNDCTLTCATEWMCYAKLCPNCNNKECPHCCRRYCGSCDHDMSWETCWQCKEEACRHCTEHRGVTFWDHLYINSIFVCYDCMSSG